MECRTNILVRGRYAMLVRLSRARTTLYAYERIGYERHGGGSIRFLPPRPSRRRSGGGVTSVDASSSDTCPGTRQRMRTSPRYTWRPCVPHAGVGLGLSTHSHHKSTLRDPAHHWSMGRVNFCCCVQCASANGLEIHLPLDGRTHTFEDLE